MTIEPAGTKLDYTVTWLEMTECPDWGWPPLPVSSNTSLIRSVNPPVWWFLALYDAVGRDYAWEDIHKREHDEIAEWLASERMSLYVLMGDGWPQGFFLLEDMGNGEVDLAYFGMVPDAVGKGLGSWLLKTAILTAWARPGVSKLTVNTCTLDHPRALQTYQKAGFVPVRREDRSRITTRDRDLSRIPD
ncbi:GNAT family N-acetyltransferase [Alphaproteobacteria bacterium GH1-50]|uniref:GNAT family N-acetyltransferase n=1 Tax=Kangsaoukella pontilimi TaxID=2691042 RepID=A0A7C9INZ3_9RHOB|nr:GNAT family N-acetyltransferase [Kangsaoukella pontilimi]MXQ06523.1 GNAT family N-acetyltransferase [Kangsaoukella pontilimi]